MKFVKSIFYYMLLLTTCSSIVALPAMWMWNNSLVNAISGLKPINFFTTWVILNFLVLVSTFLKAVELK